MTIADFITSRRKWLVRLPIFLRIIGGFLSTITSAIISLIFTLTIYDAVIKTNLGYPSEYKIVLMFIAPTISAWQFLNISSTLSALLSFTNKKNDSNDFNDIAPLNIVSPQDVSIESTIFGLFSVLLRSIAGFLSCITVCIASLLFTYILHKGILNGNGYPSNMTMTIVIMGPIIMSWTFMNASTTIKQLLKIESIGEIIKRWIHNATKGKHTN